MFLFDSVARLLDSDIHAAFGRSRAATHPPVVEDSIRTAREHERAMNRTLVAQFASGPRPQTLREERNVLRAALPGTDERSDTSHAPPRLGRAAW